MSSAYGAVDASDPRASGPLRQQGDKPPPGVEAGAASSQRQPWIDVIKALVFEVVLIHSMPVGKEGVWIPPPLSYLISAIVAGFFTCSGFLYGQRPSIASMKKQLPRLLVPYFSACLIGFVWQALTHPGPATDQFYLPHFHQNWMVGILFGLTLDHYYFIFVLLVFVLVTPLIGKLSPRGLRALTVAAIVVHIAFDACLNRILFHNDPLWVMRNPFVWLGYYLIGWHSPLFPGASRRQAFGAMLCALVFYLAVPGVVGLLVWVYTACALLPSAFPAGSEPWGFGLIRWVSENTYAMYLYHTFFIQIAVFMTRNLGLSDVLFHYVVFFMAYAGLVLLILGSPLVLGATYASMILGCAPPRAQLAAGPAEQEKLAPRGFQV